MWKECGRPNTGYVNNIQIFAKQNISKILAQHRKDLINRYSARAKPDPNMVFKIVSSQHPFHPFLHHGPQLTFKKLSDIHLYLYI